MAQVFHPSLNTISRVSIFGGAFGLLGLLLLGYLFNLSPYVTQQGVVRDQPVPFSHEHHVRGLGLDCRYCHTSVETASFAGIPPTYTCMTCHSQIWTDSPMLEPVRASLREDRPLRWARIHDLPDFAYFHHGIHIQKGIGCTECHGRVDQMPLTWKDQPMSMAWCLDCHRHPERHIRRKEDVFAMDYRKPANQEELGRQLLKEYKIEVERLTNCSVCHR
ncbi:MAG: cytochrome c3 family protein [Isosphaeraceae bacterium]|nr:cytochrome c3 family protein [Isosphaeraceae bacterium]